MEAGGGKRRRHTLAQRVERGQGDGGESPEEERRQHDAHQLDAQVQGVGAVMPEAEAGGNERHERMAPISSTAMRKSSESPARMKMEKTTRQKWSRLASPRRVNEGINAAAMAPPMTRS